MLRRTALAIAVVGVLALLVFLAGAAQVKGVPVSVQCGQPEGRKGVHPVCAGLMGW